MHSRARICKGRQTRNREKKEKKIEQFIGEREREREIKGCYCCAHGGVNGYEAYKTKQLLHLIDLCDSLFIWSVFLI